MSTMKYNKNPISLREGKVFIDGVECLNSVKLEIKSTPDVWEGRQLGERTPSTRWLGIKFTGNMTEYRSTPWIKDAIAKFKKTGATPEMTIQGIMNDANSDYYQKYGSDTVTCVGCVLTGDLPLTALDSGGDVVQDNVSFNIKDIV